MKGAFFDKRTEQTGGPIAFVLRELYRSLRNQVSNTNVAFESMIVQDWKDRVAQEQLKIDGASENQVPFIVASAFGELQPYYLKCLFSYVMMFCTVDKAYLKLYKELDQINGKAKFGIAPIQPPIRTSFIQKVKKIRDISITHMISDRANPIDAAAAAIWQPMTLSKTLEGRWDLNGMTFGQLRLSATNTKTKIRIQSSDFSIQGIDELDTHCGAFVEEWDNVCSNYLKELQSRLPHDTTEARYFQ